MYYWSISVSKPSQDYSASPITPIFISFLFVIKYSRELTIGLPVLVSKTLLKSQGKFVYDNKLITVSSSKSKSWLPIQATVIPNIYRG